MRLARGFSYTQVFAVNYTVAYYPPMIEAADIREILARPGMTQDKLAKMAGVTQPTVSRWLKGAEPEARHQEMLGALLGKEPRRGGEGHYRPAPEFLGDRDLPVYAAVEGGRGEMVISSEPIEVVPRPWYLKNVKEGYAVVVVGESMEPRYEPGDLVVVNPKAALVRGKDCIVHTAREGGDFRAVLKRYAGASEDTWRLRQLNPEKDLALKKTEWPFCVRVVGRYDGG